MKAKEIGERTLERLAQANAARAATGEELRRAVAALMRADPKARAKLVQWRIDPIRFNPPPKLRRVQQIMREIKRSAVGVSRSPALELQQEIT